MAWEKRKSKLYFYEHQRLPDGRKVKQYVGKGFEAHTAANFLTLRKIARQIEAEALRQMRAETQEADELLKSYSKRVSELLKTEMFFAGFHNPRSRGWRLMMTPESSVATECVETSTAAASKMPRRSTGDTSTGERPAKPVSGGALREQHSARSTSDGHAAEMAREAQQLHQQLHEKFISESAAKQAGKSGDGESDAKSTDNASSPPKPVEDMSLDELRVAAMLGDTKAMNRLRPLMRKDPSHFKQIGDLGAMAIEKWLDVHCRQNLYLRECLKVHITELRTEHLKEGNSPIERLLIEEVLLCLLRQKYWISIEANSMPFAPDSKSVKFWMELARGAQRMYLKALAELRDYRNAKARLPSLPSLATHDETESA